jgi:hypothetical protein
MIRFSFTYGLYRLERVGGTRLEALDNDAKNSCSAPDLLLLQCLGQLVCPRHLSVHRSGVSLAALSGEHHEMGAAVIGVPREVDKSGRDEFIHNPLDGLTGKTHVAGDMRHRQPISGQGDGAEHLPTCARQPDVGDEPIARQQQSTVQPEEFEHEFGERFRSRVRQRGHAVHTTT